MSTQRTHRAVSADGTEIVARIHGEGKPLVLVSGLGDGEDRPFLLPELSAHFACYSMSLRSRGLSSTSPDHAPERLVDDIAALADSIGGPVGLAAHSRGAALALTAAAQAEGVAAVAFYEPHAIELYRGEDVARAEAALERMAAAVAEHRLADVARVFAEEIALGSADELSFFASSGVFDVLAGIMPVIVDDISDWGLPRSADALPLEQVGVPVLLLHGSDTHPFYVEVVRRLTERLPDVQVSEVADAGHFSPLFAPAPTAERFVHFLETALHSP